MGSFPSANPSLPTSIPGIYEPPSAVVGVVPIASGGTGQTSAAAALAALGGVGTGKHAFKRGTGSGTNYTTTSGSFVAVDATNLDITIIVPVGFVLWALLSGDCEANAGHTTYIGIAVDSAIQAAVGLSGSLAGGNFVVQAVLVGDGASHVLEPQFYSASGGTATITNFGSPFLDAPIFSALVVPAA